MKAAICTPTMTRPFPAYLESLEASVPALDAAGIEHSAVFEVGCPYISAARSTMLSKALKWGADAIVFIDHDLGWRPDDLVKLILTPGDVVAGTYRYKKDEVAYMGCINTAPDDHVPLGRKDGCLSAYRIPAGFMKITRSGVERFKAAYPELVINDGGVDLFNHGAYKGVWYGEDMAFSRRWHDEMGEPIWLIHDMNLNHHDSSGNVFAGNYHQYLLENRG
jgi:glycosyltransferase involved in cell wall biosynthesis